MPREPGSTATPRAMSQPGQYGLLAIAVGAPRQPALQPGSPPKPSSTSPSAGIVPAEPSSWYRNTDATSRPPVRVLPTTSGRPADGDTTPPATERRPASDTVAPSIPK